MGDLAVMQVQKVRCAVVGFEHGQIFGAEMGVRLLARKDRKEKRQVGVVRVQQIQPAQVERIVAGHGGEVSVELVVGLRKQAAVGVGEDASELGPELLQFGFGAAVEHNRQREVAERLTVAQSTQAVAKVLDVGLLRLVHQHIARVRLRRVVAHLRDKAGLRHVEVAAALVDFLARLVRRERRPFRDDSEVGRDLQQRIERQWPRLGDGLFHRQHPDEVIAHAQMIAFGFDVRVDDLIVEKLRGLRLARNAPVVEVQQPAEERELPLLVQDLDLHEVRELPSECLHALVEPRNIALDLAAQQRLHVVVRELRFQFVDGPGRIAKELAERRAHAGLRPRAFEQNAVEDLDLIKMVALRLKELAPLLDGRLPQSGRHIWRTVCRAGST